MKTALCTFEPKESTVDFEGCIARVFYTQGCNFRCRFCHNPELIPPKENNITYDELYKNIVNAKENWIDGICITGGEPTLQKNIVETAAFIKEHGLKLKLDTQGSFPEALRKVIPWCDYIAMDYKAPIAKYSSIAQVKVNTNNILESLDILKQGGVPYEIRTTVIPGFHSAVDIRTICQELEGAKRFVLQTFIPRDNLPDKMLRATQKTPLSMLEEFTALSNDYFDEVFVR